ncbi:hypothetical protein JQ596_29715 [Bradyrhizobium manausense]|uniref:hypothetical protein n=1 Tax=Bradyrhizobium TaxID=374 RepID=UPI001BA83409|nr:MULTISPECIES: hypothetical protein [Bradyrhizobium]MBR0829718.1 hypothetical protein [Bradyrhizobium manausense]UVO25331.1 hypothetical protein KUF59_22250 [Bradyrhizobium arachidis]
MKISINPAGFEAEHLSALNRSFGNWGEAGRLRWCFARTSSPLPADVVVAELNGTAIAGTGISYRRLMTSSGRTMLAGIFTAAWSFPIKSARGAYMHVMAEATRRIAERGGAVALGFMPQNKSSGHQLLRAGAMAATTAYVSMSGRSHGERSSGLKPCLLTSALVEELFRRANKRAEGGLKFVYSDIDEFVDQFLERHHPVQVFVDATDGYFIFERLPQAMNLLAALPADRAAHPWRQHFAEAAQLATSQKCGLLAYASNEVVVSEAVAAGLVTKPGFMTVTIANPLALSAALTAPADEDAAASACLAMLRVLHVENGDRM